MKEMIIVSERDLDLPALADLYHDIGKAAVYGERLVVQNDDWGWFHIDLGGTDSVLAEFEPDEKVRLLALIGRPFFAGLPFRNSVSVNLAVSRLPATDNLFICNEYGVIFTVREIQRRLKSGEEWETVGEEFL